MKQVITFLYVILVLFTIIGATGYLFYYGEVQFAVSSLFLGIFLTLAFLRKIEIPTINNL